ncbi:MAG: class I SAM-dependent methyltransferase [Smithella sp.]|nr:class I SAM-dependent methyltransferase [Smithella sp.]
MIEEINKYFYRAFEDRYRGSREQIKLRLRVYLPFVKPLRDFFKTGHAVDLGCGRGEWLEVLQDAGFDVQGVDIDEGMLAACRERNLNVQNIDAINFLKSLSDSSQVIVTGFHVAEHISFPDLRILVEESFRVLVPGGILILETPNSENIVVGTSHFFLDPTHRRPLPAKLLFFLTEYYGFKKTKILRLQEPEKLHTSETISLLDVLRSVSPDVAVVAQKNGNPEILEATKQAFREEYGLTLDKLAKRYDQWIMTIVQKAKKEADQMGTQIESATRTVESKVQQAEYRVAQLEGLCKELQNELKASCNPGPNYKQLAEVRGQQVQELLQSHSWKITAPLRWISTVLRHFIRSKKKSSDNDLRPPDGATQMVLKEKDICDDIKTTEDALSVGGHVGKAQNKEAKPSDVVGTKTYVLLSNVKLKVPEAIVEKKLKDINQEMNDKRV